MMREVASLVNRISFITAIPKTANSNKNLHILFLFTVGIFLDLMCMGIIIHFYLPN